MVGLHRPAQAMDRTGPQLPSSAVRALAGARSLRSGASPLAAGLLALALALALDGQRARTQAPGPVQRLTPAGHPSVGLSSLDAAARAHEGSVSPTLSGRGTLILRHGGTALSYGGLFVRDAAGRTLASWMQLRGRNLLLGIDAAGARYPLQVDPTLGQLAKIVSSPSSPESRFGVSVALSADESTVLVGAAGGQSIGGAAWVFTHSGSSW